MHGFELHFDVTNGPNNLEVNWDKNNFHLEQVTSMIGYDDPLLNPLPRPAPFDTLIGTGIGRLNGVSGYTVSFKFTDNGEPGTTDVAQIEIRDPQGKLVLFVSGNLHNGNQQAQPENKAAVLLQAAAAPVAPSADVPNLQVSQLPLLFAQARREWARTALSAEQMARIDTVRLVVADLPGLALGQTAEGVITIDADAAGWGWFIDRTPGDDSEYMKTGGVLTATTGPAAGHIDLLTVIAHELGHAMGLQHTTAGLMADQLVVGVRKVDRFPLDALEPDTVVEHQGKHSLTLPDGLPARNGANFWTNPEADAPVIDFSGKFKGIGAWSVPGSSGDKTKWVADFVNHLGRDEMQRNPNADLRLHIPVSPPAKLSALDRV